MIGRWSAFVLAMASLTVAAMGCVDNSGEVLDRIPPATPPGSNLRTDVLLVRALSTCAAGPPCTSSDPNQCYVVTNASGPSTMFDPNSVELLAPDDPGVSSAPQSACFTLGLDDGQATSAQDLVAGLRTRVFQLTGGDINLDVRIHEVAAISASFKRYPAGLFLPPAALEGVAIGDVDRETDFVFAITGPDDATSGLTPQFDPCIGTNWIAQGSFGGSTFTWAALTEACAQPDVFLRAWLAQLYFGLRDVAGFGTAVAGSPYPCGQGGSDPTRWFPWIDDCTIDPDVSTCGAAICPDYGAFDAHVLSAHWRRGRAFNGNYCNDGRMDFDETGVDSGGKCDLLPP